MAQKTTLAEFEAVWPTLQAAILEHAESYKLPQKELDWFKKVKTRPGPIFKRDCNPRGSRS